MKAQLRLALAGALIVGAIAGFAPDASAQDTTLPVQKRFRIKIGGFFPTDGDTKDALGSNFFSYGISYDFAKSAATNPAIYNIYYDGTTKSRDGFRATYHSLGGAVRFSLNPATEQTRFYAGPGLGVYAINTDGNGNSDTDFRVGGKLFAGAELNNGLFGEVDYTIIDDVDEFNPSGFNVSIGYRF